MGFARVIPFPAARLDIQEDAPGIMIAAMQAFHAGV
jgi:hypothetical protein